MLLRPVKQCQFELSHTLEELRIILAFAHLVLHILADFRDTGIAGVCLVGNEQIQLGVLLNLNAELIEPLDGCVAGEEVLRTGAEGNDLQILNADDGTGNGEELAHLCSGFFCRHNRILRDKASQMPHAEVVGAVEHAAVCVAAAVDQVSVTLCCSKEHNRSVKEFCNQCLRCLRSEVSEKYRQGIAARSLDILNRSEHVLFIFYRNLALIEPFAKSFDNGFSATDGQGNREAVSADSNDAKFYFWNVFHVFS